MPENKCVRKCHINTAKSTALGNTVDVWKLKLNCIELHSNFVRVLNSQLKKEPEMCKFDALAKVFIAKPALLNYLVNWYSMKSNVRTFNINKIFHSVRAPISEHRLSFMAQYIIRCIIFVHFRVECARIK